VFLTIDPVAFSIGPFSVRWYGILIATAILLGTILALRESERQGWDPDHFLNLILYCVPAAFVGARLYYVIFNWDYYSQYPKEIPAVWHGGLAIHGALIAAFIVGYLYTRYAKLSFWQAADIAAPSIILGQAIGRWGNFFNQEAYGYEVDPAKVPWAMYIDGAYRHPTFLYESLWNLGVFFFLLWFRRKPKLVKGDVFLTYAILYSVGRFFVEGLRTDSLMLTPYLRAAQVVSVLAILAAGGLMYYRHKRESTKAGS
jgi:phosphatidylglycerol:prolipoprotein diacylglycerol transferase